MRNLYFFLFLLPVTAFSQISVIDLFKNSAIYNKSYLTLGNHTVKTYTLNYDDEKKPDMSIMDKDNEVSLSLASIDKSVWTDNKLNITSTSPGSETVSNQVFVFDDKGNAISRETVYSGDENMSIMNENLNYAYDDKNRLINIKGFNKETKLMQDMIIANYVGDDILPTSAALNMVFEFDVDRTPIADGFRYNVKTKVPQDLKDMLKEELGPNATEEAIMKELQSFGILSRIYSDITFLADGKTKEEMYEEDKQESGKINLKGVNVYDKDYNILEKNAYEDGVMYNSLKYQYNDKGQPTTFQMGEEEKMVNEFDAFGNVTKEYLESKYTQRTYTNGKLTEEREYTFGTFSSLKVYSYE